MTQAPDPDDIFRVIEEDNEDLRNTEVKRLLPKLRAFKSHFTGSYNILANLITATRGINDPASVDKLLSIPQADFNLEEVHRVAVACEAAKNYTGLNNRPDNVSCKVSNKGFGQYRSSSNTGDDGNASNQQQENDVQNEKGNYSQDYQSLTGSAKIKALKDSGKCVRCGKDAHAKDSLCPHLTTTCHKCGSTGHISPVCARK